MVKTRLPLDGLLSRSETQSAIKRSQQCKARELALMDANADADADATTSVDFAPLAPIAAAL